MAGTAAAIDYFAWIGREMARVTADRRSQLVAAMAMLFDYEKKLAAQLLAGLQNIPGVKVLGITDTEAMDRRVPTVSFVHEGSAPNQIAEALANRNIFVWSGHNYALEVANALGIDAAVRIGAVHYNSADEVDTVLNELESMLV
jgi:selenocysteine lyase/cysteine desulfurase